MPLVENMGDGTLDGAPHQIWQGGLTIRDHRHFALAIPTLRHQTILQLPGRRLRRLFHKTKAPAHIGALDLAHHNIEVALLEFRSASDVCAI